MSQRLIFPFTSGMIICGYKTLRYKSYWGYPHYGIDISSYQGGQTTTDHIIRASGEGTVVWCQYDNPSAGAKSLGWAIAIQYNDCIARDGSVKSFVVRYMHSPKVYVKKGQRVKAGDPIADEGNVGTKEPHVHMELDVDTNYPQYTPQVSAGHSGWKGPKEGAKDSTVNPSIWLWQDATHKTVPYNFGDKTWITGGIDDNLPVVPTVVPIDTSAAQIAQLKAQIAALQATIKTKDARIATLESENTLLAEKVEKARELFREGSKL